MVLNCCNAVGYCNACKTGATTERIIINACNAVWNYCTLTTCQKCIGCSLNNSITIISAIINGISICYNYACKAGATNERIISNACYAVRDFNAGKAGAILESRTSNACNAVGCTAICNTFWDCYTAGIFIGIITIRASSISNRYCFVCGIGNVVINAIDIKVVGCSSQTVQ